MDYLSWSLLASGASCSEETIESDMGKQRIMFLWSSRSSHEHHVPEDQAKVGARKQLRNWARIWEFVQFTHHKSNFEKSASYLFCCVLSLVHFFLQRSCSEFAWPHAYNIYVATPQGTSLPLVWGNHHWSSKYSVLKVLMLICLPSRHR